MNGQPADGKSPVELHITARSGTRFVPFLKCHVNRTFRVVKTHVKTLSIALVGDITMSRLHRQFMNIEGPTDVLTFELEHDRHGRVVGGEIVICVPQAVRQARKHGTTVQNELLLYAVHGLLHLSGYDDLTESGYRAMHREEDRILTALKIGPIFDPAKLVARVAAKRHRKKDGRSR